jgi:hypothetical protein
MKAMGKITITLILILATSLFLTSCSGIVTPELPPNLEENLNKLEEIDSVYLEVAYEKYAGANWCLPASGAMTLKYFGFNVSHAEIASALLNNICFLLQYFQ